MAKNKDKEEQKPGATQASSEENTVLVEVQAIKTVNTTLYGNIYAGQKGKIGFALAEQLAEAGEVKIIG